MATSSGFWWDASMHVSWNLLYMLVGLKFVYVLYDGLYSLFSGNYYKRITSFLLKHVYKFELPFDAAIDYDRPGKDIEKKRRESLKNMNEKFKKFIYDKVIMSTDSKLSPKNGTYTPSIFGSLTKEFKIPYFVTEYKGCNLYDINNNKIWDLSSGNAANIIGNKKNNDIIQESFKNGIMPGCGFSSIETYNAINNILKMYDNYYDCVSFIESGSTAVESCIKQTRFYHYKFGDIKRNIIVMFKNAYHGWVINPYLYDNDPNIVILNACDTQSLQWIIDNYLKIASIFVDPMKVLSINKVYPRESLTFGQRKSFDDDIINNYVRWMKKIEDICKTYGILFVLDECYSGFRVGPYGATKTYDLKPNYIILSKQLGAGLNTSCIVSKQEYMQRKKDTLQVVFTTGTGSTNPNHHRVISNFIKYALTDEYKNIHSNKMKMLNNWCDNLNKLFIKENLPLNLKRYYNTFSLDITINSAYNWMLCWKLISENIVFTPGGSTKFTISFDYNENDLNELTKIFIKCGKEMMDEGWFYVSKNINIKKEIGISMALYNIKQYCYLFVHRIREDKEIDVGVSHNHPVNQWTHFWSSVLQIIISYVLWGFYGYKFESMLTFLVFHILRQSGHFLYEAQLAHDEKVKIGYKNATKKKVAMFIPFFIVISYFLSIYAPEIFCLKKLIVLGGLLSVANRFIDISQQHGFLRSFSWFIKIITDPFTDIADFKDSWNPFHKKMNFKVDFVKINQNKNAYFYDIEY